MKEARPIFILIGLLILIAAMLYGVRRPIMRSWAKMLIFETPVERADAIVLLAGGFPRLEMEAADLYREKLANKIIIMRERDAEGVQALSKRGVKLANELEQRLDILRQLGVMRDHIIIIEQATETTRDEASKTRQYLLKDPSIQSVVVVARRVQTARAYRIFKEALKDRAHVSIVASRYDSNRADTWWHDTWHLREMADELLKYIYNGAAFILPIERR